MVHYDCYGGRGIRVCDNWLGKNGFTNFYNWALENGYKVEILGNGLNKWTLDRIDVNGNYEPSNCRFVDIFEQNSNTRYNRFITYKGETKTITQWARCFDKDVSTINNRIKRGWSFEKAMSVPSRSYIPYSKNKYIKKVWNKKN